MPTINFSGIASGIDTEALIKATSDATRATRERPSQEKITQLTDTNDALSKLKGLFKSLQTITYAFSSVGSGLLQKRASSSDETTATAVASSSASNGAYSVTVNQLARGHTVSLKSSTTTYTSSSDAISPGVPPLAFSDTVTIKVGYPTPTDTIDIDITETTTLSEFVNQFNGATSNAVASVVNVGTSASPNYQILIKSLKTGLADGQVYWDAGEFSALEARVPPAFDSRTEEAAQDAQLSISGISGTITRPTNSISDLITGVTFNLKATGGPTTITVSDDSAATSAKMQDFIDKFNEIVAFINDNNQVVRQEQGSNVTNTFNPLSLTKVDDNALQTVKDRIFSSAYYNTSDSSTATNEIRIFAELGITTNSDPYDSTTKNGGGTLNFDASVFTTAVAKEPESVKRIMQAFGDAVGRQTGVIQQYIGFNQLFDTTINSNTSQITDLNKRIAEVEAQILQTETNMRQRFAQLEANIGKMQQQQSALSSALSSLPRIG